MADFVRRALAMALACVVTGLGAWTAQAADPPAGALKVATVDLQRVVDQYQKRKDMQEDLKKFKAGTEASLKGLQKQVDAVKGELDLLNEDSPDYDRKKRELEEKREVLVLKGRLAEKEVVEKWAKGLETIYNEILDKIHDMVELGDIDPEIFNLPVFIRTCGLLFFIGFSGFYLIRYSGWGDRFSLFCSCNLYGCDICSGCSGFQCIFANIAGDLQPESAVKLSFIDSLT